VIISSKGGTPLVVVKMLVQGVIELQDIIKRE
jgi:high-affinity K+ transport system ATPase subunit B